MKKILMSLFLTLILVSCWSNEDKEAKYEEVKNVVNDSSAQNLQFDKATISQDNSYEAQEEIINIWSWETATNTSFWSWSESWSWSE